jgi:hypothetical protein
MPEYLRHLDNPINNFDRVKEQASQNKSSVTVISKINGWITVDP